MLHFCQGSSQLFDLILCVEVESTGALIARQVYPVSPPEIDYEKNALRFCFPLGDTDFVKDKFTFAIKKGDTDYSYGYVMHYQRKNQVVAYCTLSQHFDQLRILQMMELIVPKFEQNNAKSACSIAAGFQKPNIHGDTILSEQLVINSMVLDLLAIFPGDVVGNLIAYIAADSKIVIQSSSLTRLSKVCFALISLMFPLHWPGAFIPLLPARLQDAILAPFPFIIGIPSALAQNVSWEDVEAHVFLNADTGQAEFRGVVELPKAVRSNVKAFAKSVISNHNELSARCQKLFISTVAYGLNSKSTDYQDMQDAYNAIRVNEQEDDFTMQIASSQTVLKLIHSPEDENVDIFNAYFPESDKPSNISLKLIQRNEARCKTQFILLPEVRLEVKGEDPKRDKTKKGGRDEFSVPEYLKSYGVPVMPIAINRSGLITTKPAISKSPVPTMPKSAMSNDYDDKPEERTFFERLKKKKEGKIKDEEEYVQKTPQQQGGAPIDISTVQLRKVQRTESGQFPAPTLFEFQSVQLKKLPNRVPQKRQADVIPAGSITPPCEFEEDPKSPKKTAPKNPDLLGTPVSGNSGSSRIMNSPAPPSDKQNNANSQNTSTKSSQNNQPKEIPKKNETNVSSEQTGQKSNAEGNKPKFQPTPVTNNQKQLSNTSNNNNNDIINTTPRNTEPIPSMQGANTPPRYSPSVNQFGPSTALPPTPSSGTIQAGAYYSGGKPRNSIGTLQYNSSPTMQPQPLSQVSQFQNSPVISTNQANFSSYNAPFLPTGPPPAYGYQPPSYNPMQMNSPFNFISAGSPGRQSQLPPQLIGTAIAPGLPAAYSQQYNARNPPPAVGYMQGGIRPQPSGDMFRQLMNAQSGYNQNPNRMPSPGYQQSEIRQLINGSPGQYQPNAMRMGGGGIGHSASQIQGLRMAPGVRIPQTVRVANPNMTPPAGSQPQQQNANLANPRSREPSPAEKLFQALQKNHSGPTTANSPKPTLTPVGREEHHSNKLQRRRTADFVNEDILHPPMRVGGKRGSVTLDGEEGLSFKEKLAKFQAFIAEQK